MKKMMFTLMAMLTIAATANAMSYEQARNEALFLTDKMAYELNLSDAQYEAAYEINLDYLMSVATVDDLYGTYWERRNLDLSYVLFSWQWDLYRAASYFFRPLYWDAGYWHFGIYARYPHRDYFYFGRPHFYASYRGGHSWRMNSGRSYYEHHRDHYRPGHITRDSHFGMRNGWDRGDFRNNHSRNSSTRFTGGNHHSDFGNGRNHGGNNGSSFGNGRTPGGNHNGGGNHNPGGNHNSDGNHNPGGNTHSGSGNNGSSFGSGHTPGGSNGSSFGNGRTPSGNHNSSSHNSGTRSMHRGSHSNSTPSNSHGSFSGSRSNSGSHSVSSGSHSSGSRSVSSGSRGGNSHSGSHGNFGGARHGGNRR